MHLPYLAVGAAVAHPDHLVFPRACAHYRPEHLGAAQQTERRLLLGRGGQQLEEIPLRHQGDVLVRAGDSAQVDVHRGALHAHGQSVDLAVRHSRELGCQPQFVEQAQGAGVHGVAAEVAQEVGVLLHDRDVHACAGQQQSQHHPRGSATGDEAGGVAV